MTGKLLSLAAELLGRVNAGQCVFVTAGDGGFHYWRCLVCCRVVAVTDGDKLACRDCGEDYRRHSK